MGNYDEPDKSGNYIGLKNSRSTDMRTFIAIELPQEIQNCLSRLQSQLDTAGASIKWVEKQNIHLTLKFLGEVEEEKLEKIFLLVDSAAQQNPSFGIKISYLGAFPREQSPRIIWAGLETGDEETKIIAKELEEKLLKLGIPKEERAFSSHITIGRARSGKNLKKLSEKLTTLKDCFKQENLNFTAGSITLYKSTLTPKGPIYEILKTASLKAT